MQKIDIKRLLLSPLKKDYESQKDQTKFFNGLDYLEAMLKFFSVLNISVVKEIDNNIYNKIFLNNFKISPSFGDFKSLETKPFLNKYDALKEKTKSFIRCLMWEVLCD